MRIALVGLTHPFRGGISHYTTLLYTELERRHDVHFFTLRRQYPRLLFPGRTQIDHSGDALRVPNDPCLDSINPLSWWITAVRIRRFRPDLVLFSWWHPFFAPAFGTVARLARRIGRAPSCFLCHNVIPHEPSVVDRLLLRYAFSSAAAFITHSHEEARKLKEFRPRANVFHSPHPTYEAFVPETRLTADEAKLRLELSGRRVLLFFGFVRAYKGLNHLLEAMDHLPPEAGYHLLVVGEFYEDRARYEPQLDILRQRGQLTLVDRYVPNEEVPLYFSAADVVMVPYLSATQSGIVQMAYGFGRPVIATAVGGLPEVVFEGRTGSLVPPADASALARAVRRLFEEHDPQWFGQQIGETAEAFSWDRMVETIEQTGRALARDA
jgi:glycosyltransferase involved in cell wall biosynthesis